MFLETKLVLQFDGVVEIKSSLVVVVAVTELFWLLNLINLNFKILKIKIRFYNNQ